MSPKLISLNAIPPAAASSGSGTPSAAPGLAGPTAAGPLPNPFVGLRPFRSTEGLYFFGRYEPTTKLLQRLHETRFLAIVGSSGCGKSSLIYAGLIPKLSAGFLAGERSRWRIAVMKPGDAPLRNLVAALLRAFDDGFDAAPADAREGRVRELLGEIRASGFEAVARHLSRLEADTNFFLLVDQFEEIFRFGLYDEEGEDGEAGGQKHARRAEAADFVSFMLELARQTEVPAFVVMTMRSDFLGDCDAFYGLPEAMNRSQYLVPRLTRQQRQEAIEGPVHLYDKSITPQLVDRLLNDVGDEPDQLPVMQHALMRTWENWRDSTDPALDIKHYEAVGTVKEALSRDADRALEEMSEEERTIAKRLFQALTDVDARGRQLRRPAHLSQVAAIAGVAPATVLDIVERFRGCGRSFLTLSGDAPEGDPLIDISHESLIRQWGKLGKWVEGEAKAKDLYVRLAGDAARHNKPVPEAPLWSDPALQLALDWWEERQPNEAWARRYHKRAGTNEEFLKKSAEEFALTEKFLRDSERKRLADTEAEERARRQELEQARAVAEQRRQYNSRLKLAMAALALLLLLAAGAAAYALNAQRVAQQREAEATSAKAEVEKKRNELEDKKNQLAAFVDQLRTEKKSEENAKNDALKARDDLRVALKNAQAQKNEAEREKVAADEAKDRAVKAQTADDLHREATRRLDEYDYEEAHNKFNEALGKYRELENFDGVAHTYVEMGRLRVAQKGTHFEDPMPDSSLEAIAQSGNVGAQLKKGDLLKQLLGEEPAQPGLFGTLRISADQQQGLKYFGQAIQTALTNTKQHKPDYNESATAWNKVGDFLSSYNNRTTLNADADLEDDSPSFDDSPTANLPGRQVKEVGDFMRRQAAVASYCKALADYQKASNLKAQYSVLWTLGDRIGAGSRDDGEEGNSATGQHPVQKNLLKIKGCAGFGPEPLVYYDQTVPLYEESLAKYDQLLAGRPADKQEEQKQEARKEEAQRLRAEFASKLTLIGALYAKAGQTALASERFEKAVGLYKSPGDIDKRVATLISIASSASAELAGQYLNRAAQEYEAVHDYKKEAETFVKISRRYSLLRGSNDTERYESATSYLNKAVAQYDRLQGAERLATRESKAAVLIDIGSYKLFMDKHDEALAAFKSALELYSETGNKSKQAVTFVYIARVYNVENNTDAALAALQKALQLYQEMGDKLRQGYAYYIIALTKEKRGDPDAKAAYAMVVQLDPNGPYSKVAKDAIKRLEAHPNATPTPSPQPQAGARKSGRADIEADLTASLAGEPIGGRTPRGTAEYEVNSNGDRRTFAVHVKGVNLPAGTVLRVLVDGAPVNGTITLSGDSRHGKLDLDTYDDEEVPEIDTQTNVVVTVADQAGNVILKGTLSNVPQTKQQTLRR